MLQASHCKVFTLSIVLSTTQLGILAAFKRHTTHGVTCPSITFPRWEGGTPYCPGWGLPHSVLEQGNTPSCPGCGRGEYPFPGVPPGKGPRTSGIIMGWRVFQL